MSEHFSIKSEIDYYHLPYDDETGKSWCHFCKKTCEKASVEIHEGLIYNRIEFICGHCHKIVWVSKLKLKREILNRKCAICGNAVSWFNSYCVKFYGKRKRKYFCSKKCLMKKNGNK